MNNLQDKVALVTGGAKGIGASLVRELLEEGVKQVRVLDLDEIQGRLLEDELNEKYGQSKAKFVKCDVTNDEQFFGALEDAKDDNGYIDLLVNNAGIANEKNFALIRKQIEINFTAVVIGTLKAVELMRTDKGGRGGTVINVSSVAGLLPLPFLPVYKSTKRAVLEFSYNVGKGACQNTGVRVMSVCFGPTDTAIFKDMLTFNHSLDHEIPKLLERKPFQSAQVAAQGVIEIYQKGEVASTWLVVNGQLQDITPELQKEFEDIAKIYTSKF